MSIEMKKVLEQRKAIKKNLKKNTDEIVNLRKKFEEDIRSVFLDQDITIEFDMDTGRVLVTVYKGAEFNLFAIEHLKYYSYQDEINFKNTGVGLTMEFWVV